MLKDILLAFYLKMSNIYKPMHAVHALVNITGDEAGDGQYLH